MAWKQQLGEEIAKARRRAGLTQEELEDAIGVSRQTIGLYERGKTPPPFETLAIIATALKADQFVVEDLHITFSRNGKKAGPEPVPQQLKLDFDTNGGVTIRIESTAEGILVKAVPA
jgi:transcriptional regulator with XRE-family HTH domain